MLGCRVIGVFVPSPERGIHVAVQKKTAGQYDIWAEPARHMQAKRLPPSVRLHNSFAVVFLELRLLGFGEQLHESAMSSKGTSPPQSGSHTIQAAVGRGSSQQDDGTRN